MNKIIDKIIADEASMAVVSLIRRIAHRAYIAGLEAAKEAAMAKEDELERKADESNDKLVHGYPVGAGAVAEAINTLIAKAKEGA